MKKLLLLFVAAIVTTMTAHSATYYGFKIGGVEVNSDNYQNVTGSNITGKVVYDPDTKTVTLTNVTIARTGKDNRAIYNEYRPQLTVVLQGTCNLSATESAPLRFERHTTIVVPEGSKATITGGSEGGIYLTNSTALTLRGYGTINITATSKGGIEGSNDSNQISFQEGIKATIKGGGGDLLDIWRVSFSENSKVTLRATNNSSNPNVKNVSAFVLLNQQLILAPIGATFSETAKSVVLNGNNVSNADIFVSSDYVALFNSYNFPDANFRNCMLELFPKGYITQSDVDATTSLNVSDRSITSLTGIRYFTALTSLNCNNNNLSTLAISSLTNLTSLDCSSNNITSLYLESNTKLTSLDCSRNQITTLDLNKNTALRVLYCYYNNISGSGAQALVNKLPQRSTSGTIRFLVNDGVVNGVGQSDNNHMTLEQAQVAIDKNWYLTYTTVSTANPWNEYLGEVLVNETNFPDANFRSYVASSIDANGNGYLMGAEVQRTLLDVGSRGISSLKGIEYFTKLTTLYCDHNNLSTIDLSKNIALKNLYCQNNNLTTIDLSKNIVLQNLYCYNNKIIDEGAQIFVDKLPIRENGVIRFKYNETDVNELTAAQAQTANNKNWQLHWCGSGVWVSYTGVEESITGDVDGDGKVDVTDVNAIINIILKTKTAADYQGNPDVDGDGKVDVTDVNAVINLILKV